MSFDQPTRRPNALKSMKVSSMDRQLLDNLAPSSCQADAAELDAQKKRRDEAAQLVTMPPEYDVVSSELQDWQYSCPQDDIAPIPCPSDDDLAIHLRDPSIPIAEALERVARTNAAKAAHYRRRFQSFSAIIVIHKCGLSVRHILGRVVRRVRHRVTGRQHGQRSSSGNSDSASDGPPRPSAQPGSPSAFPAGTRLRTSSPSGEKSPASRPSPATCFPSGAAGSEQALAFLLTGRAA